MQQIKLPNAAAHILTITSSATSIEELIETAGSSNVDLTWCDGVDLIARTNGFSYLSDGNTPTATNGLQIAAGGSVLLRGVNLANLYLIRSGGSNATVECNVGKTNPK